MSVRDNFKTFLMNYDSIRAGLRNKFSYRSDKRLSHNERKILHSLSELKKGKSLYVIQELESFISQFEFIESYRLFVLGMAYGFTSQYEKSEKSLNDSISLLKKLNVQYDEYRPLNALTSLYYNRKDNKGLKYCIKELKKIDSKSVDVQLSIKECQLCAALISENPSKAIVVINDLIDNYSIEIKQRESHFLLLKLMAQIKLNLLDDLYETLERYKNSISHKIKPNYKYLKTLLDFYLKGSPLYIYEKDFKDNELLYNELQVIKNLSIERSIAAKNYWNKLMEISPLVYLENYNYAGDGTLFLYCLERVKMLDNKALSIDLKQLNSQQTIEEKLVFILKSKDRYISKHELSILLWDEEWTPKIDSRLRSLIYKLKKTKQIHIKVNDNRVKIAS